VIVIGADERARQEVTVKNMETGEQRSVPRAGIAESLKSGRGRVG
jgi:histidyl-tRNA synthetase